MLGDGDGYVLRIVATTVKVTHCDKKKQQELCENSI